ncbi:MAG: toxin-antitoxin system TumE family protein [Leptospirales bacterium]
MGQARILYRDRKILSSGAIIEMVIWKLDLPDPDRPHGYKYRFFYGRKGQRLIGYDNEKGKGDHRHCAGREEPYVFSTVERLLADFLADVSEEEGT